jgi:diguanylate cyclase (GGDEF)-like protein
MPTPSEPPQDRVPTSCDAEAPTEKPLLPEELADLHILRRVSPQTTWAMFERCQIRTLEAGETLLTAGHANQTMYMVLRGSLRVHLDSPDSEPVATLVAGQTVGEISVLDDSPVTAHVVAIERTRLLAVDEQTFWRLVFASHEFSTNLLLLLAQRMRATSAAMSEGTRLRRQYEREATLDALTGLYNRRWLNDRLPRVVMRHQRGKLPLTLLMIDVDHFKRFNDTYGHATGDVVLQMVGSVLIKSLRPTDLVARYGGEELVVILPDTNTVGARAAAERVRSAVAATPILVADGRTLPAVTVSIGIAELGETMDAGLLLAQADTQLYKAKDAGRNRIEG